jgi:hypothetical protein
MVIAPSAAPSDSLGQVRQYPGTKSLCERRFTCETGIAEVSDGKHLFAAPQVQAMLVAELWRTEWGLSSQHRIRGGIW